MATQTSQQIVIGPARSGFALLLSVLAYMGPLRARKSTLRKSLLELFATHLGNHISEQIVAIFAREGLSDDLVYNGNFRALLGGPRWALDGKRACYRKYIGARGHGDLMLIIAHPLALFECDDIIHSHVDPASNGDGPALVEDRHPPLLLYSRGRYNLVAHDGRFVAIPQSIGPIDPEREDVSAKPGVLMAPDLHRLEAQLETMLGPTTESAAQ